MNELSGSKNSDLRRDLKRLEDRIAKIEEQLNIQPDESSEIPSRDLDDNIFSSISSESFEYRIGEFWLAKIGIIILAIGVAFVLTFPYENLPPALPVIFGYLLVIILFFLSHLWRNSYIHMSRYFLGGAFILFYFTSLRLYFFTPLQIISDINIELLALIVVVIITLSFSIYKKAIFIAGIGITLGFITAVISDSPYILFIHITILAIISVYLKLKHQWNDLYTYSIILSYMTHFLWFLNNPLMGNEIKFVSVPAANLFFLLIYATIFASGNLLREKNIPENNAIIISTFLNCAGSFSLLLLISLAKFKSEIFISHLSASLLFLIISILFWLREKSKVSTFFYAMAGYTTLSLAIVAQFENPIFFILLCWQSLLVISTAIWYRSKFIIVANFMIYLIIYMSYILLALEMTFAGLSFGFAALISARILNWQKDTLELKTEFMRNAYLVSAFFMFPYILYQLVPERLISLSWVGMALFYYIISRIIQNKKYRWMALFTLLITVVYTLVIGITRLEPEYRIISFVVLGLVLISTSFIYSKLKSKSDIK